MARSAAQRAKHQQNMATINTAILNAQRPTPAGSGIPKDAVSLPNIGPAAKPMNTEQKQAFRVLYQGGAIVDEHVRKMNPQQRAIYDAQVQLLGQEEADQLYYDDAVKQLEDERRSLAEKAAVETAKTVKDLATPVKNAVHGADVRLGRLPTPGSIAFPLMLLLLFFFILIQVKGNSRVAWLWLVLTNNAYTGGSSAISSSTTSTATGGGQPQTPPVSVQTLATPLVPIVPVVSHSANGMYSNPF